MNRGQSHKKRVKVSAPGKLILSGEHGVVYGFPALVSAVNLRLAITAERSSHTEIITEVSGAEKHIKEAINIVRNQLKLPPDDKYKLVIESQLTSSGMGSSAALAACLTTSLAALYSKKLGINEVNNIAYKIEELKHTNPSGVDNTITVFGGTLWYRKETADLRCVTRVELSKLPQFVIIDSGLAEETTAEMVALVNKVYVQDKDKTEEIFRSMESLTRSLFSALLTQNFSQITKSINENDVLLDKLGIVSKRARLMIEEIKRNGGAAKISGAGGKRTGSGIIMEYHKQSRILFDLARKHNWIIKPVRLATEGLRYEK